MAFDPEALRQQIPYYLTADPAKGELIQALKSLNEGATQGYFIPTAFDRYKAEMLQGDGWTGFQVYSFSTGRLSQVRGIVLSNSCDVAPENARNIPPKIIFSPIVKLSGIRQRFESAGLNLVQIDSKIEAIKSQSVTNMFFIPSGDQLDEDYVALLDDLHSIPVSIQSQSGVKIFTLSMAGFYLFIFKLSVHLCRLHENVDRSEMRN